MTRGKWIDYDEALSTHGVFFARDPTALDVWWNTRDEKLWLYDDSVASRLTYFARLEKLMLRQVEVIG
ncbi:hypothetical protein [Sphingomonas montana]|uniref:hypothetical protein n=1 Tax=Sphingomonas montana TaxID=1843236 RepID=UPI00101AD60F|nr:hypothetical protein [Sphingomonas montana]